MGDLNPYLTHASLGPPESSTQTASRLVQPFLHSSPQCPNTVQWAAPSHLKIPLPMGRSGSPSNTWFLRPTRVLNPNGISIG